MKNKPLIFAWFLASIFLFLYSFTQIDLGLTLTRLSFWQIIQHFFQHIGYFERSFSALLYLFLLFIFFSLYIWTLIISYFGKLVKKDFWIISLFLGILLLFSYNAFSYDLFNYMFDAKIFTFYHQNPYFQKALDYSNDPMLGFMHWTHRTYPYGPFWLILTVPLSFLGFNYLLPTFYLFKMLTGISFLATIFFLEKSLNFLKIKKSTFCLVFFAFNPLVLVESLVSGHNDIVMMFLAIFSFYLLLKQKYLSSFFWLITSIGIKFATAVLLPFYLLIFLFRKKFLEESNFYQLLLYLIILSLILATIAASLRTNFQPWYLLYFLPFLTFLSFHYFIFIPIIILSFFSLLTYLPFLYLGTWNPPVPNIINIFILSSFIISIIVVFIVYLKLRIKNNRGQLIED